MYQVIHPSYIKAWSEKITLEEIQIKLGKDKETCLTIVNSLIERGVLILIKKTKSIDLDINKDGKVDQKDFSKAGKILNKSKKK